uniref:Cytochrome P450 n=1 Tax=Fagus sylvatica TaxID=28930 RepID=A0A2N9IZQ5_FAGSY
MENLYFYLVLFLSTIFIIKVVNHRSKNLPPSPFSLPIIGHLHLLKQPLFQELQTLSLKYGPILSLKFGSRSILVVSSPSVVEECFTKNDIIFANRPRIMAGDHFTYNSTTLVWAPYGHLWRNLRRVANIEIFSNINLQKSSISREEEVYSVLRQVYKVSNTEPQKVELRYLLSLLVSNIMMKMVVGKPCVANVVESVDVGKELLKEFKENLFANLLKPPPSEPRNDNHRGPAPRWSPFTLNKELRKIGLEAWQIQQFKRSAPSAIGQPNKPGVEFWDQHPHQIDPSRVQPTHEATRGIDTTATTMEWTMSLLLNHPEILQKIKAEIDSQVGHERLINDLDLAKLPYLRCVINETLRLDLKLWEEPTRFKPDRFEATNGEREGFKFIPFGVGRRACPWCRHGNAGNCIGIRCSYSMLFVGLALP